MTYNCLCNKILSQDVPNRIPTLRYFVLISPTCVLKLATRYSIVGVAHMTIYYELMYTG